jgi:apolipoprotein N-acyltransferase
VVWPENVVNVTGPFGDSEFAATLSDLSRQHDWLLSVGIVEDVVGQPDRFNNAQIVFDNGEIVARYDKVRRVPFGEFIPARSTLESLGVPLDAVPKDAIPGTEPAVLDTRIGPLGVVISWEVFFGGRARDAIGNGGEILINPTNGSSYTGTVLQTQQIASSRLRALETARPVLQAAPTGLSAFISEDGDVLQRSAISEPWVGTGTVERWTGDTLYVAIGDRPFIAFFAIGTIAPLLATRRRTPQ